MNEEKPGENKDWILRAQVVSKIEEELAKASKGAIAVINDADASLRADILEYFRTCSDKYSLNEEVLIDANNVEKASRYNLFIMRGG